MVLWAKLLSSFESMRQTILEQAQSTFVAEQTAKRQNLDVDPEVQLGTSQEGEDSR
jgi:hypothetical protein